MKKILFIYNPLSGLQNTSQKIDYVIDRFQENNILIQFYRISNTNQDMLVNILGDNNFSYIIIVGGDGTLNSIINLMFKNNINLPVGIIPTGTCNDFASSLNLPSTFDKCIDIIINGQQLEVDVGLINQERYFLSTCAGGILTDVAFKTDNKLKKNFGPLAYYLQALSQMADIRPFNLKIQTDTQTIEEEILLFLISNGTQAGGFSNLMTEADISDGIMDIVLIKNCHPLDLANLAFSVMSSNSLKNKNVLSLKTKNCTIEGNNNILLTFDGEEGCCLPLNIEFINKALKVFIG